MRHVYEEAMHGCQKYFCTKKNLLLTPFFDGLFDVTLDKTNSWLDFWSCMRIDFSRKFTHISRSRMVIGTAPLAEERTLDLFICNWVSFELHWTVSSLYFASGSVLIAALSAFKLQSPWLVRWLLWGTAFPLVKQWKLPPCWLTVRSQWACSQYLMEINLTRGSSLKLETHRSAVRQHLMEMMRFSLGMVLRGCSRPRWPLLEHPIHVESQWLQRWPWEPRPCRVWMCFPRRPLCSGSTPFPLWNHVLHYICLIFFCLLHRTVGFARIVTILLFYWLPGTP